MSNLSDNQERFNGKKVLVTGASGGIGSVLVSKLRREGALVAVTDFKSDDVEADVHFDGDLMDSKFCDLLPSKVAEYFNGIDILFNNAGVITRGKITETSDEDYYFTMGVNVEAPFRLCRAAIPLMKPGSAIVNTASCWGLRPGPDHPLYVMSKSCMASLTQCLGRDHASDGIRVNAVCPNEVNTKMIRSGFEIRGINSDKALEELNKSVPLGRIAEPEDIVDVMLFLASDAARYICGSLIEVNGGKPVV